MKIFVALVVGALLGAIGMTYWFAEHDKDRVIMFPSKILSNFGEGFRLEGSLIGEGENRPINGMLRIDCYKSGDCRMLSVDQLSEDSVSFIHEDNLRVESWDGDVVRLTSFQRGRPPSSQPCNYFEIRVDFSTEDAAYTRIPNKNATNSNCSMFLDETLQWRIDDGYAHQRFAKENRNEEG
uniref:hypothetical protein n=1 Tax=Parerythrobacter lutipelagi TaxID=1964208 RepID=UPI0010F48104|nr:hypothetical protein [Parerythrobacter lutipelagi]